jgi:hypothetical protein
MTTLINKAICLILIASFLVGPRAVYAEAVDETYSRISPERGGSGGEYIHGQKSGKLLIRTLLIGALPQQGIHYIPEGTDLLFAILYAGGYTENSKLNGISIRRRTVKELIEVDLEDLIEDGKDIPKLLDGDIVTIPYNWRRDIGTITLVTGFVSSMTAFALALIALTRNP